MLALEFLSSSTAITLLVICRVLIGDGGTTRTVFILAGMENIVLGQGQQLFGKLNYICQRKHKINRKSSSLFKRVYVCREFSFSFLGFLVIS